MLRRMCTINLEQSLSKFFLIGRRFKGHSHWQNTRHIKVANDLKKAQLLRGFMWKVQGAVNARQGDTNPLTNPNLAQVLEQAKKECVSTASLLGFLKKISEHSVEPYQMYLKGPENYVIVITYDKKRHNPFRQGMKKVIRNSQITLREVSNVDDAYTTKGIIISKPPDKDITLEKAEEDAIIAEAEEVEEIESSDKDERVFQFITLEEDLWKASKALKEQGWTHYESRHELVPLFYLELPEEKVTSLSNLLTALEEIPEVERVVVNVA